jgi:hypothetical protein
MTDEMSSNVTGVEVEVNENFEKLADEVEGKVNNMVQKVQVDVKKCTDEKPRDKRR